MKNRLESYRVPVTYRKIGDFISWRAGNYHSTLLTGMVQEVKNCKDDGVYYKVTIKEGSILDGTYYICHDQIEV